MKKSALITLIFVFVLCTSTAFAQFAMPKIYIKGGYNAIGFSGDLPNLENTSGFHYGAGLELELTDKIAVAAEVLYNRQGAIYEFDEIDPALESTIKLNYIAIPVLGKYYIYDRFALEAGPQFSYLVNATTNLTFGNLTETFDIKSQFTKLDVTALVGASYVFESGFLIGVRLGLGVNNIAKTDDNFESYKLKNNLFQCSLGYRF